MRGEDPGVFDSEENVRVIKAPDISRLYPRNKAKKIIFKISFLWPCSDKRQKSEK